LITEEALDSDKDKESVAASVSAKYKDSATEIVSEMFLVIEVAKVSATTDCL